jgi:dTDP-4-dehydrorhamnose 3,5-epimerase
LHEDERGFFARIWDPDEFSAAGLTPTLAQSSLSRNALRGTLRGLHFQRAPHQEVKLVRCVRGAVFDVVLDLRPDSSSYLRALGVELTHENGRALYVPEGCAHGYQTLLDDTDVLYFISRAYAPEAADGVRWDDPAFNIAWPDTARRTVSERDRSWPDFRPLGR